MLEPFSTAATPPTTTNSMPASLRRCSRLLSSLTHLPARQLCHQHAFQRRLVLQQPLFRGEAQAGLDETEVESGLLCALDGCHAGKVHRLAVRSIRNLELAESEGS